MRRGGTCEFVFFVFAANFGCSWPSNSCAAVNGGYTVVLLQWLKERCAATFWQRCAAAFWQREMCNMCTATAVHAVGGHQCGRCDELTNPRGGLWACAALIIAACCSSAGPLGPTSKNTSCFLGVICKTADSTIQDGPQHCVAIVPADGGGDITSRCRLRCCGSPPTFLRDAGFKMMTSRSHRATSAATPVSPLPQTVASTATRHHTTIHEQSCAT